MNRSVFVLCVRPLFYPHLSLCVKSLYMYLNGSPVFTSSLIIKVYNNNSTCKGPFTKVCKCYIIMYTAKILMTFWSSSRVPSEVLHSYSNLQYPESSTGKLIKHYMSLNFTAAGEQRQKVQRLKQSIEETEKEVEQLFIPERREYQESLRRGLLNLQEQKTM